jgi:nitroreductase
MVRSFDGRPVPPAVRDRILANAQRAPSAGYTQGWAFLVLEGPEHTERYWDSVLPDRAEIPWPGLLRAPLLVIALAHKQAYLDRYAEADKAAAGRLREGDWPVPYWHVDAGFAALLILLTAVDAGLGALFFSVERVPAFRATFDIPESYDPVGAVAIGYPAPDRPSASLRRGRRPPETVLHWGRW